MRNPPGQIQAYLHGHIALKQHDRFLPTKHTPVASDGTSPAKKNRENPFEEPQEGEIIEEARLRRVSRRHQRPVAGKLRKGLLWVERISAYWWCTGSATALREGSVLAGFRFGVTISERGTAISGRIECSFVIGGCRHATRFLVLRQGGRMLERMIIILSSAPEG
jgi:hypothetical protein